MEIIYHERRPNFTATVKSLKVGDEVTFPLAEVHDPAPIRVLCSKIEGTFSVNKSEEGLRVTRTA